MPPLGQPHYLRPYPLNPDPLPLPYLHPTLQDLDASCNPALRLAPGLLPRLTALCTLHLSWTNAHVDLNDLLPPALTLTLAPAPATVPPPGPSPLSSSPCTCSSLTALHLAGCEMTQLPTGLWRLVGSLRSLDLSMNRLSSLPPQASSLTRLTYLDLSSNQLRVLPLHLCTHLSALRRLSLRSNQFVQLPEGVDQLCCLEHLDMSVNRLQHLPDSLSALTTLTCLIIACNPMLGQLPPCFRSLTSLRQLDARCTGLTEALRQLGTGPHTTILT